MRLVLVAAALVALSYGPAKAAWKSYVYKDLGVAKDFPAEPILQTGLYTTPLARQAPETIYTAVKDGVQFRLIVVDFRKRADEGANLLAESAAIEMQGKGVTFSVDDFPLYDRGANSVVGLLMRVDRPNGDRVSAMHFFNKGRLYIVQAIAPEGAAGRGSPDIARFMDSIVFHLQGYGFDFTTGHDYPIGDDDPNDRDTQINPNYKPAPGYENAGQVPAQ